jgi:hypothetical protein
MTYVTVAKKTSFIEVEDEQIISPSAKRAVKVATRPRTMLFESTKARMQIATVGSRQVEIVVVMNTKRKIDAPE